MARFLALVQTFLQAVILAVPALVLSYVCSFAAMTDVDAGTVIGVDVIKADIYTHAPNFHGLGPWRITVQSDHPERFSVQLLPLAAFRTDPTSDPRLYVVSLIEPDALLDENGIVVDLGVAILERESNAQLVKCQVAVSFVTNGTHQPIPVESIFQNTPQNIRLEILPAEGASWARYQGTQAILERSPGDMRPVQVILHLFSGGRWVTFQPEGLLPACTVAQPQPAPTVAPGPSPLPQPGGTPAPTSAWPKVMRVKKTVAFSLSSARVGIALAMKHRGDQSIRRRDETCTIAKQDLFVAELTDYACAEQAVLLAHEGEFGPEWVDFDRHADDRLDGQVYPSRVFDKEAECSCELVTAAGSKKCFWSCQAIDGVAQCVATIEQGVYAP